MSGHDDHIECFNGGGFIDRKKCSVQDKCGKCNGCGDGVLVAGEECDDGNNVGGDGCDPDCKIECASDAACADTDICTNDICDPVTHHCTHTNNTAPCDDGDACTENDQCSGGTCAPGTPKSCDDGIGCTIDSCDSATGQCSNDASTCECTPGNTVNCNDNDPCTDDSCGGDNKCQHTPNTGNSCDDGLFCNGDDTCSNGVCEHAGDPCSGNEFCNNVCDEANNDCARPQGTTCQADEEVCTDDQCDGNGNCVAINNNADCDDNNACTIGDVCDGGGCEPGTPKSCDDGIECTVDSCDSATGDCSHDTSGCQCTPQDASNCDDHDPCTDDSCGGDNKCQHTPNTGNSCDDGLFCNGDDTCQNGTCEHTGDPCPVGGECNNICNEDTDNCFTPEGVSCQEDNNPCTDNQCDGNGNCIAVNNTIDCDDNNPCTLNDVCSNGECSPGTPKDCSDARDCSVDSCNPANGVCQHDVSQCQCASDADCNDSNSCTTDTCDIIQGTCSNVPAVGSACNDGNQCTKSDQCQANGSCIGTPVISVACGTASGGPVCGNGIIETGEDCDDGNQIDNDGCDSNCKNSACIQGAGISGSKNTPGCGGSTCSLNTNAGSSAARAGLALLCLALIPCVLLRGLAKVHKA